MMMEGTTAIVDGLADGPTASVSQQSTGALELADRRSRIETLVHAGIVLVVLASATALRIANDLDTATISTVYGAALGYATGLRAGSRP